MALLFTKTEAQVRLWSRSEAHAAELARRRINDRHLPGIRIPDQIRICGCASEVMDGAELVVAAVPTAFLRSTLAGLSGRVPAVIPFLSVVKGIENGTFARPSQIIVETLGARSVAVLSGPSHAEELARGLPASVVVAGIDERLNQTVRETSEPRIVPRLHQPRRARGRAGRGLEKHPGNRRGDLRRPGFGDNAKAALLTRGLVEIARLGSTLGAQQATFYGLAGVGDLITTCYSPYGRNRAVGERIGRGETLEEVLAGMVNVAEGVPTTRSVHELARSCGVEMPITAELYQVLFEGKRPSVRRDRPDGPTSQSRVGCYELCCLHECAHRLQGMGRSLRRPGRRPPVVDRSQRGDRARAPCGFHPEHEAFWLYPTHVHQAEQGLRDIGTGVGSEPQAPTDPVSIRALAVVECVWNLRSEDKLPALAPFHYWTDETLRTRYRYRQPGLWVLGVRMFRQEEPWSLTPTAEQLGCKSWVILSSPVFHSSAPARPR